MSDFFEIFSGFFLWEKIEGKKLTFFLSRNPESKKLRYIPKYTWKGLVRPMWSVIRAFTRAADLTLVPSATMKATLSGEICFNLSSSSLGLFFFRFSENNLSRHCFYFQ